MSVRKDVATLGPGWNKTLLNYALAMQALDDLPLSNRNSWKFLGAIHGFSKDLWVGEELMDQSDPVPTDLTDNTYGNQCQHGSWFFCPGTEGICSRLKRSSPPRSRNSPVTTGRCRIGTILITPIRMRGAFPMHSSLRRCPTAPQIRSASIRAGPE